MDAMLSLIINDNLDTLYDWSPGEGQPTVFRTAAMIAAQDGNIGALAYLLAAGANPNLQSPHDGYTALHCAAEGGSPATVDIIALLLKHGADREAINLFGRKPVDLLPRHTVVAPKAAEVGQQAVRQAEGVQERADSAPPPPAIDCPDEEEALFQFDGFSDLSCDFLMYSFKVAPCSNQGKHDWSKCPYAHAGEKLRRRDPKKSPYSCEPCPDFRKTPCKRGEACGFAHGMFEAWLHPGRFRTQLCADGAGCTQKVCFLAHSTAELRGVSAAGASAPLPKGGLLATATVPHVPRITSDPTAKRTPADDKPVLENARPASMSTVAGGEKGDETSRGESATQARTTEMSNNVSALMKTTAKPSSDMRLACAAVSLASILEKIAIQAAPPATTTADQPVVARSGTATAASAQASKPGSSTAPAPTKARASHSGSTVSIPSRPSSSGTEVDSLAKSSAATSPRGSKPAAAARVKQTPAAPPQQRPQSLPLALSLHMQAVGAVPVTQPAPASKGIQFPQGSALQSAAPIFLSAPYTAPEVMPTRPLMAPMPTNPVLGSGISHTPQAGQLRLFTPVITPTNNFLSGGIAPSRG